MTGSVPTATLAKFRRPIDSTSGCWMTTEEAVVVTVVNALTDSQKSSDHMTRFCSSTQVCFSSKTLIHNLSFQKIDRKIPRYHIENEWNMSWRGSPEAKSHTHHQFRQRKAMIRRVSIITSDMKRPPLTVVVLLTWRLKHEKNYL